MRILFVLLVAVFLFILGPQAEAQETMQPAAVFKDDSTARALYNEMMETIGNARSLSYRSDYHVFFDGVERGLCSYRLWLEKPGYVRMEAVDMDGKITGIMVGDGEAFWLYWPNGRSGCAPEDSLCNNVYMLRNLKPDRYSIAHDSGRLGSCIIMTVLYMSAFHGARAAIDQYFDGVMSLGTEKVGGEECDVVEVSIMNRQRSRFIWIARNDHLPRKLKEVVRTKTIGEIVEYWSDINLNNSIPSELFIWKPPAGWNQYYEPQLQENLLKPGADAPDFELPFTDGQKFRLSEQRGKVVFINFWRVGCPACREEVPFLQTLHERYSDQGLVVIGLNCTDKKDHALKFLEKNRVTYANIVDTSQVAIRTTFEKYQTSKNIVGTPFNYVVDANGKVVDAWYGYKKEDLRFEQALKKAGLHQ